MLSFLVIDYCIPKYQLQKLQRIQNMAAKLVFRQPKFSHVTPLLTQLHWLPVEYRIEFKLLILTFKGLHGLAPEYIQNMFVVKTDVYSYRSSTSIEDIVFVNGNVHEDIQSSQILYLQVPKTSRKTFYSRSLPVAGPVLWNKLPSIIRMESDFDQFKKRLKTHLFKRAFYM